MATAIQEELEIWDLDPEIDNPGVQLVELCEPDENRYDFIVLEEEITQKTLHRLGFNTDAELEA